MTPADSVRRLMQTESCCRAESVLNLARWINDFDIASRSKQMVSKEGPKMGTTFFRLTPYCSRRSFIMLISQLHISKFN